MLPVAECSLKDFMSHAEGNEGLRTNLKSFFVCLANALHYLHSSKIRHRDVKPENVLVKDQNVYLTDFGISLDWEHLSRSTTTEESGRTLMYCAPEVADQFQKRNSSTDIWSLGAVFMEIYIVTRGFRLEDLRTAFYNNSETYIFYKNQEVTHTWLNGKLEATNSHDKKLSELVSTMLLKDASARPSASTVFNLLSNIQEHKPTSDFCRECFEPDPILDGEVSDDDVWMEDHDEDEEEGSGSLTNHVHPAEPIPPQFNIPKTSSNLSTCLFGDLQESREQSGFSAFDSGILGFPDICPFLQEPPAQIPDPVSFTDPLQEMLEVPDNIGHSTGNRNLIPQGNRIFHDDQAQSILYKVPTADVRLNTGQIEESKSLIAKIPKTLFVNNKLHLQRFKCCISQELLNHINFEPWPTEDMSEIVQKLGAIDWSTPDRFLSTFRPQRRFLPSNVNGTGSSFLLELQGKHPASYELMSTAQQTEIPALLYSLLCNGFESKAIESKSWFGYRQANEGTPYTVVTGQGWRSCPTRLPVAQLLIAYGFAWGGPRSRNNGPVIEAIQSHDFPLLQSLLRAGADPDEMDNEDQSALWHTARMGDCDAGDALIRYGATKLNYCSATVLSPMHIAIESSRLETLKFLHKAGASHASNMWGDSSLHVAARTGNLDIVKWLYETCPQFFSLDEKNASGKTPITLAFIHGHSSIAKYLIETRANAPEK